jgi:hypothetical protein
MSYALCYVAWVLMRWSQADVQKKQILDQRVPVTGTITYQEHHFDAAIAFIPASGGSPAQGTTTPGMYR